jgi:hypothetical protein
MRNPTFVSFAALLALGVTGCLDDGPADKGPEDHVPVDDAKLDSFDRPTEHGAIAFGVSPAPEATLTATTAYHTWTFVLSGPASIHAFTGPSITGRQVIDTVLYLYKQKPAGNWGSYVVRNDDSGGSLFSSITRNLDAGTYRILAKGYTATTFGRFSAHVECTGAGCSAPAPTCLFGATFGDLLAGTATTITGDRQLHVGDVTTVLEQQRVVLAVQQSAHTDVATVAEAFAAVDQQVIRRVDLYDAAGARAFVALEYGAGDNSYGAVFAYNSATIVASIHDGDLERCTARTQTCLLGPDWSTTRTGGAFTIASSKVVTAASQLSGVEAVNALAAIRVSYPDTTSLASGLGRVDDRQLNVVNLVHTASGAKVTAFEYGAGDNSYGAIFKTGASDRVASIVDLTYYDCALAR